MASGISRMKNSFRSGFSSAIIKVVPGKICDIVDVLEARGKVTNRSEKGAKKIMARDVHWELVCSEKSRPFAIETFRLKVPNGWLYCNTITRARALTRDEFSQSMVFVPDQLGAD
jgi:hypothetical protein